MDPALGLQHYPELHEGSQGSQEVEDLHRETLQRCSRSWVGKINVFTVIAFVQIH